MNLFYHPDARNGNTVLFDAAESLHMTRALRKKSGDVIDLTDGCGHHFTASLDVGKRETTATIISSEFFEPRKNFLEVAMAPTKNNERLEWLVEKAVEIGIDKISLILCDHSERPHLKTDRLLKIAISAMKQSLRFYLPEISPLIKFSDWAEACNQSVKCIAYCDENSPRRLLQHTLLVNTGAAVAIGPEGDFSSAEIAFALSKGFHPVSLGDARLRTETAALAAVHTFELVNQK